MQNKPYFTVSIAAKTSFMRPILLSVLFNPSLENFCIFLITSVCSHNILQRLETIYINKEFKVRDERQNRAIIISNQLSKIKFDPISTWTD